MPDYYEKRINEVKGCTFCVTPDYVKKGVCTENIHYTYIQTIANISSVYIILRIHCNHHTKHINGILSI